jgi:hypothetical protein
MAEVDRVIPPGEPDIVDSGAAPVVITDTPPAEPLDARGVPYKNTVAELERKLKEKEELNTQYQTVLGQYQAQQQQVQTQTQAVTQPAKAGDDDILGQYSEQDRKAIEIIAARVARTEAEKTGYRFVQQAAHQNVLADNSELMEEARKQYSTFKQNQVWAQVDDILVQDRAIAEAEKVLLAKKNVAASQQAVTDANRQGAASANLPNTSGQSVEPPEDKEAWVKKWKEQWENVAMMKKFHRGVEQNSPEWIKLFQEYAEEAWNPTIFSGTSAVGQAYRELSQQQQQERS